MGLEKNDLKIQIQKPVWGPSNTILILLFCIFAQACSNNMEEIQQVLESGQKANIDVGKNIRILYSDSAQVHVIVNAPILERYTGNNDDKDVFPKGILLEFLNDQKIAYSHLKADYAVRDVRNGKVVAKGNVIFYKEDNQKIESPELIWDEKESKVYTEKIVRIIQAEKGDTTYGIGFIANQEFTRFEIKKKVQGKFNVDSFVDINK